MLWVKSFMVSISTCNYNEGSVSRNKTAIPKFFHSDFDKLINQQYLMAHCFMFDYSASMCFIKTLSTLTLMDAAAVCIAGTLGDVTLLCSIF